jgi:hypothetical protein
MTDSISQKADPRKIPIKTSLPRAMVMHLVIFSVMLLSFGVLAGPDIGVKNPVVFETRVSTEKAISCHLTTY